jgi:hypothetical protein
MLARSKVALSFAIVFGAASVALTAQAFAQDGVGRGGYATGSQKADKQQTNRDRRENAIREDRLREPGTLLRWIDNPASPGG